MKKSLFVLGVAVAALASCTQSEVLEVAENRAIGFDAFVGNTTKTLPSSVAKDNFRKFYVYGAAEKETNIWTNFFTNVEVTGTSVGSSAEWTPAQVGYWTATVNHNFGAYANGTNALTDQSGVSFDAETVTLTFLDYQAGANDLVAATAKEKTWDGTSEPSLVELSFKHMLSKLRITFKTDDSYDYKYSVSGLKIDNAVVTASGSYKDGAVQTWNGAANETYTFDLEKLSDFAADGTADGDFYSELFVIPQSNTNTLKALFTVTAEDKSGNKLGEKNFEAELIYNAGSVSGTTANTWTAGYAYNYTATINLPQIVDDETKEIKFNVTAVEDWTPANENGLTSTEVNS